MTAELLIYAIIAAGLIFWLRSILGTRDEDEPQRPPLNIQIDEKGKIVGMDGNPVPTDKSALVEELAENPKGNMAITDRDAEKALYDIAQVDREFDIYKFLQAAQDAFVFIVESFADGDRDTLKDLLGDDVYNAFDNAITAREKSGEKMMAEIQAIEKSEICEARLEKNKAFITVRFWAEEVSVTKDENGEIVAGHPEKITKMRDVWTFTRDLKSRDPRWFVVETREDGEGDNEAIPNTH